MKITIELKVNGSRLEMGNSTMSLDLINPILNDISDYSLPFSIPGTPNNMAVLGIDNEINTFISSVTFDNAELKIGEMILKGSVVVEGAGPDNSISATFYSARSTFLTRVKGKYLTDISYSELIYNATCNDANWLAKIRDSAYHKYPDYNYVFAPVYMPNYKDDVTGKVEPFIVNKWDKANNTFYYAVETGDRSSHFAPFFYLHFVIKKIFETYGFAFTNEVRYTDWFLPSKDELKLMYTNLHAQAVGGFAADDYWSSSEYDKDNAYKCNFLAGAEDYQFKDVQYRVRACRSFISEDVYALRDPGPTGGLIFNVIDNLDGTYTYYEAAPADQAVYQVWSNISDISVGSTGTAVGTGAGNTSLIISQEGHISSAAKLAEDYLLIDFGNDTLYNDPDLRQLVVFHTNVEHFHLEYADFSKHLPHILITDFIRMVEQKLNLRFLFSNHSGGIKIAFVNDIIQQDPGLDLSRISDPRSRISLEKYDGFEIPTATNSDNDSKSSDFKNLENSTFSQLVENSEDLVNGDYGDIVLVKNANNIFRWVWNGTGVDPSWQLIGSSFVNMRKDGNNVLSINQDAKDLEMYLFAGTNAQYLPRCDNERRLLPTGEQTYEDLTLLFYCGIVPYQAVETASDLPVNPPDSTLYYVLDEDKTYIWHDPTWFDVTGVNNGNLGTMDVNAYPLLSNAMYFRVTNSYFAPLPGSSHSLSLFGDNGLFAKYWEKYIYWMLNLMKKEQRIVNYDERFFNNFEWDILVNIKNQKYFISRIPLEIDFARQRISFRESELLSL
jgi:hypothetical protein